MRTSLARLAAIVFLIFIVAKGKCQTSGSGEEQQGRSNGWVVEVENVVMKARGLDGRSIWRQEDAYKVRWRRGFWDRGKERDTGMDRVRTDYQPAIQSLGRWKDGGTLTIIWGKTPLRERRGRQLVGDCPPNFKSMAKSAKKRGNDSVYLLAHGKSLKAIHLEREQLWGTNLTALHANNQQPYNKVRIRRSRTRKLQVAGEELKLKSSEEVTTATGAGDFGRGGRGNTSHGPGSCSCRGMNLSAPQDLSRKGKERHAHRVDYWFQGEQSSYLYCHHSVNRHDMDHFQVVEPRSSTIKTQTMWGCKFDLPKAREVNLQVVKSLPAEELDLLAKLLGENENWPTTMPEDTTEDQRLAIQALQKVHDLNVSKFLDMDPVIKAQVAIQVAMYVPTCPKVVDCLQSDWLELERLPMFALEAHVRISIQESRRNYEQEKKFAIQAVTNEINRTLPSGCNKMHEKSCDYVWLPDAMEGLDYITATVSFPMKVQDKPMAEWTNRLLSGRKSLKVEDEPMIIGLHKSKFVSFKQGDTTKRVVSYFQRDPDNDEGRAAYNEALESVAHLGPAAVLGLHHQLADMIITEINAKTGIAPIGLVYRASKFGQPGFFPMGRKGYEMGVRYTSNEDLIKVEEANVCVSMSSLFVPVHGPTEEQKWMGIGKQVDYYPFDSRRAGGRGKIEATSIGCFNPSREELSTYQDRDVKVQVPILVSEMVKMSGTNHATELLLKVYSVRGIEEVLKNLQIKSLDCSHINDQEVALTMTIEGSQVERVMKVLTDPSEGVPKGRVLFPIPYMEFRKDNIMVQITKMGRNMFFPVDRLFGDKEQEGDREQQEERRDVQEEQAGRQDERRVTPPASPASSASGKKRQAVDDDKALSPAGKTARVGEDGEGAMALATPSGSARKPCCTPNQASISKRMSRLSAVMSGRKLKASPSDASIKAVALAMNGDGHENLFCEKLRAKGDEAEDIFKYFADFQAKLSEVQRTIDKALDATSAEMGMTAIEPVKEKLRDAWPRAAKSTQGRYFETIQTAAEETVKRVEATRLIIEQKSTAPLLLDILNKMEAEGLDVSDAQTHFQQTAVLEKLDMSGRSTEEAVQAVVDLLEVEMTVLNAEERSEITGEKLLQFLKIEVLQEDAGASSAKKDLSSTFEGATEEAPTKGKDGDRGLTPRPSARGSRAGSSRESSSTASGRSSGRAAGRGTRTANPSHAGSSRGLVGGRGAK
jgi:hypothetical protein